MGSLRNIKSEAHQDQQTLVWLDWSDKFRYNRGCILINEGIIKLDSDLNYFDFYDHLRTREYYVRKDLPYFEGPYNYWIRMGRDYSNWKAWYRTAYGLIEEGIITIGSYFDYHNVLCFEMGKVDSWFQYWDKEDGCWTPHRFWSRVGYLQWARQE
jgi:hypothetical protein